MNRSLISSLNFKDFIDDIKTLGVNIAPLESGVNDFGVLSSRSNDRYWLLPLFSPRATQSGLKMFQPMTKSAQVAHMMIDITNKFGFNKLWCKSIIGLNGLPQINVNFPQQVFSCAYYTGTAGPHRKSTIQLMANDGHILGYIKISRNQELCKYISNEAAMLRKIKLLELKSVNIPNLLIFKSTDENNTILITDSRRKNVSYSPVSLGKIHVNFLHEITSRTIKKADKHNADNLSVYVREIAIKNLTSEWKERLLRGAVYIKEQATELYLCMNHGDFTPWNIFIDYEGLYVFDWEYSNDLYPVGYDLTRFQLCLPNKLSQEENNHKIINLLSDIYFNGDRGKAETHYYISLILFSAFYLDRSLNSLSKPWQESVRYAKLIDSCLKN